PGGADGAGRDARGPRSGPPPREARGVGARLGGRAHPPGRRHRQARGHRDGPARGGPGRAAPRRPGRDAGGDGGAAVPGGPHAADLRGHQRDPEARDRPRHPEGEPVMTEVLREEDMSPEYRRMVVQLMESQAYRELAAAHMFGYGLRFVPDK